MHPAPQSAASSSPSSPASSSGMTGLPGGRAHTPEQAVKAGAGSGSCGTGCGCAADPYSRGFVAVGSAKPMIETFLAMGTGELLARYRVGVENFDRRLFELSHAELDTSFREETGGGGVGRWSCRVLVGHLADAEVSFVHRMRRIVAEDGPLLTPWDENAFIDCQKMYGIPGTGEKFPVGAFVGAIHSLRMWTGEWLATLDRAAWERKGLHPQRGEQTLKTILTYSTWHVEHHGWLLNRKIARLRGEAVAG